MPKLLSVNPTGYFSYGLHHTVQLDNQGLVLLNGLNKDRGGTANGAGKTSLFNVICQILFNRNPSGETGEAVINEFFGKCFGRIIFLDDQNVKWRITETKKWRKTDKYPDIKFDMNYVEDPSQIHDIGERYSGTDVFLERWDGQTWVDERSTNTISGAYRLDLKATRKKLIDILHMDYDQFMNVGYMAQQQSLKFINGTHKERLEVLGDLIKLDIWDERIIKIRQDLAELESEKIRIESELLGLQRAGVSITAPDPTQLILWDTMIQDYEDQVLTCDMELKKLDTVSSTWHENCRILDDQIQSAYKDIRSNSALRINVQNSLNIIMESYTIKCRTIRDRPKNIDIVQLETLIAETRGQVQARRIDLEQLQSGAGKCSRCRTNVTIEHLLRQRELLQIEIKEKEEEIRKFEEKLSILNSDWQESVKQELDNAYDEYVLGKQIVESQLAVIDTTINDLNRRIDLYREQKQQLGADPAQQAGAVAQKRLLLLSERARAAEKARSGREQKEKHDEHKKVITQAEMRLLQYQEDVLYLQTLDKLFGDKGLKAWKLNNLLSELNYILKEYIDIITDRTVSLWITQYREKTDGEMTADIQIMVREGHKKDVPFALYSGGERQQVMLAFIGAFWQLASRHGAGINTLFLDEILGPLDDLNAQRVFNFIEHMRQQGKSTQIIVTHNQNIKDQIQFNKIWTVVKTNHISTLTYEE